MSEYAAALAKANKASTAFRSAQEAYRSRKIGDAEFLAAQAAHKAAQAEFDIAYAIAEQDDQEPFVNGPDTNF